MYTKDTLKEEKKKEEDCKFYFLNILKEGKG